MNAECSDWAPREQGGRPTPALTHCLPFAQCEGTAHPGSTHIAPKQQFPCHSPSTVHTSKTVRPLRTNGNHCMGVKEASLGYLDGELQGPGALESDVAFGGQL